MLFLALPARYNGAAIFAALSGVAEAPNRVRACMLKLGFKLWNLKIK